MQVLRGERLRARALVRYNYSPLTREMAAGRRREVEIEVRERWNPTALNAIRQPGCFETYVRRSDIDWAVAQLRMDWGDMPVHINLRRILEDVGSDHD